MKYFRGTFKQLVAFNIFFFNYNATWKVLRLDQLLFRKSVYVVFTYCDGHAIAQAVSRRLPSLWEASHICADRCHLLREYSEFFTITFKQHERFVLAVSVLCTNV
jgi:hypothetical protein